MCTGTTCKGKETFEFAGEGSDDQNWLAPSNIFQEILGVGLVVILCGCLDEYSNPIYLLMHLLKGLPVALPQEDGRCLIWMFFCDDI